MLFRLPFTFYVLHISLSLLLGTVVWVLIGGPFSMHAPLSEIGDTIHLVWVFIDERERVPIPASPIF